MKKIIATLALTLITSTAQASTVADKVANWKTDMANAYGAAYAQTLVNQGNAAYDTASTTTKSEYFNQTSWYVNGQLYTNTSFEEAIEILGGDTTQYLHATGAKYQYQYSASKDIYRFRIVKSDGSKITSYYGQNVSEWIYAANANEALIEWTEHVFETGYHDGFKNGFEEGYLHGYNDGYIDGFEDGYHEGYIDGKNGYSKVY